MTFIHCVMNDIHVTKRQSDPEKLKTRSSFSVALHGTNSMGKKNLKAANQTEEWTT